MRGVEKPLAGTYCHLTSKMSETDFYVWTLRTNVN